MKFRLPSPALVVAVAALVFALAGAAWAAIPDSSGVFHGCVSNRTGVLRVIDSSNTGFAGHCFTRHHAETAITWNQTGPQGPAGVQGLAGPQGKTGPQGPPGQGLTGVGQNTQQARPASGARCTLGQIILSASVVGTNGIPANGQLLQISQYTALFSLLGNTYGGDGKTTFALPNLGSLAPNGTTYSICSQGDYPLSQ